MIRHDSAPGVEIILPTSTSTPELKVYLSGAVVRPGVYILREGDRLDEASAAAGGTIEEADLSRVNLALRVRDQDHFHIPRVGEVGVTAPIPTSTDQSGLLNINTATVQQLEALPGIGPVKASAIVDYRQKNGAFERPEQIMQVSGIGSTTFGEIQDRIYVGETVSP